MYDTIGIKAKSFVKYLYSREVYWFDQEEVRLSPAFVHNQDTEKPRPTSHFCEIQCQDSI